MRRPLLALLVGTAMAAPAGAATVKSVSVEPAGADVRVVVTLDDRFDAPSAFMLNGPHRLAIDLPGNKTDNRSYEGQGLATRARAAQFSATTARIVVDLSGPAMLGDVVAADNKLTVTLRPADAAAFGKLVAKGRTKLPGIAAAPTEVAKVEPEAVKPEPLKTAQPPAVEKAAAVAKTGPVAEPLVSAAATTLKPKATPARAVTPLRAAYRPLVVIDAGHGGKDVGALSVLEGKREKDVTLAIARAVARELESSGRIRVMLTRTDDRFLPLPQRVAIAQAAKAHLFISIHADAAPVPEARGATVYTLSEVASDKEAARLAAKENKSDILAGINVPTENADVADILIDLAQRETMNVSSEFAATLQREMSPKVYFKSNAHRFAGFRVLKAPDVPSILLETGYVSNETDSRFLFSEAGQKAIAEGVRKAVEAHFLRRIAQR